MNFSLSKIQTFVKLRFNDIILLIVIILLTMLAFACGYITAKYQAKDPITISNTQK